ncbi:MAG: NAD(P)/FAD-dependent oxidoreductase [Candidatus Omnitrophota bacterium]|nr:NAD(P)/FAD-dependent oxidoreductase [Candidatus Omnitrophota bacterium]
MRHGALPSDVCDVAVVGAGAAGAMAAIRAGQLKKNVILIERNASIGRKILLTGKGRCNLTNTAPVDTFIEKFGKHGPFLRTAFFVFFNQDLMDFFKANGLALKEERQGRVFPEDDKSSSVVKVLEKALADNNVRILYDLRLMELKKEGEFFRLGLGDSGGIISKKVILATGGASYKATGSTGDGFRIAKTMGHTFAALKPGLVPLTTKESWVKDLQGLTLKNIRVTFECEKKKIASEVGELLFTHFGVSGPLVLDLSNEIVESLWAKKQVSLFIDLKPGLTIEQLDNRLLREIETHGSINIKNMLKEMLPLKLSPVFINLLKLDAGKRINQLEQKERQAIISLLKGFKLTIGGTLPLEEAMVTLGGISTKEINPRTMESKVVPGLYFAGEMIDAHASSGGYNLQQAFSTGYLAGEKAAECAK